MNSRVSWSVDGIDPSVRERAEAAARRAGMTLNDWVNSTIGEPVRPATARLPAAPRQMPDVADIHQRLDSITRQIEQISRPAVPRGDTSRSDARNEPTVARQLNEAISRLDARLSQISNPAPTRQAQMQEKQRQSDLVERAAAQVYRPSPPLSPASMDFSIAEIVARQNELDGRDAPDASPIRAGSLARSAAPGRIFRRSSSICSRSPARSRRCSVPITSRNRSRHSAANSPRSAKPSPRRCRAARSNCSRTKSARCPAASTRTARRQRRPDPGRHREARSAKSARCCVR